MKKQPKETERPNATKGKKLAPRLTIKGNLDSVLDAIVRDADRKVKKGK